MLSYSITLVLTFTRNTFLSTAFAAPPGNAQLVDSTLLDIDARHSNVLLPVHHYGEDQQEDDSRPFHWTRGAEAEAEKRYDVYEKLCERE